MVSGVEWRVVVSEIERGESQVRSGKGCEGEKGGAEGGKSRRRRRWGECGAELSGLQYSA